MAQQVRGQDILCVRHVRLYQPSARIRACLLALRTEPQVPRRKDQIPR